MYVINKFSRASANSFKKYGRSFFQKFNRDIITAVFVATFKSKFSF